VVTTLYSSEVRRVLAAGSVCIRLYPLDGAEVLGSPNAPMMKSWALVVVMLALAMLPVPEGFVCTLPSKIVDCDAKLAAPLMPNTTTAQLVLLPDRVIVMVVVPLEVQVAYQVDI